VAHSLVGIDTNLPAQPQMKCLQQPDIKIMKMSNKRPSTHALLLSHLFVLFSQAFQIYSIAWLIDPKQFK
jgi:hypothetical protein